MREVGSFRTLYDAGMKSESGQISAQDAPAGTLLALLAATARRDPNALALLAPRRAPLTYGRLVAEVESVAATLRELGIGPGDRVGVVLPSGPEMAVAFLGITARAACVPFNPAYLPGELEQHLRRVGVTAMMVEGGVASPAREVAQRLGLLIIELVSPPSGEAGVSTLSVNGTSSTGRAREGLSLRPTTFAWCSTRRARPRRRRSSRSPSATSTPRRACWPRSWGSARRIAA